MTQKQASERLYTMPHPQSDSNRVLFISNELIGADLAHQLKREGDDVRLYIDNPTDRGCFEGMVAKTSDWRAELDWVGKEGLIIFDDVGYGEEQDSLRAAGYKVIGGSRDGDRLEQDREYGQHVLKEAGVSTPATFMTLRLSLDQAIDHIKSHGGQWVIKHNTHNTTLTYVSVIDDGSDAIDMLMRYKNLDEDTHEFSIQKKVDGVEIALGRFFNGRDWVGPIVFNREHKHLAAGDTGPLGAETGTLMWYEYDAGNRIFEQTLGKLREHLSRSRYIGYIDLNCIIAGPDEIYPLELTSRFGSSTNQLQSEMNITTWHDFFHAIARGQDFDFRSKQGYGINVALTIPPFPYRIVDDSLDLKGTRVYFRDALTEEEISHLHFEDTAYDNGSYVIAGNSGLVLYVTGVGRTVHEARDSVYSLISKIYIPKMFYRTDIGLPFFEHDLKRLQQWGWI
jgi:phosphoribosylamine---glycine ligase